MPHGNQSNISVAPFQRIGSALFYGLASFSIMFVNKIVLSIYEFPSFSFLAACQFLTTAIIIFTLTFMGKIQVTEPSWHVIRVLAPLVIISFINVLTGLGGTQRLNLPMFTVLRRFSILMTMMFESYIFGNKPSIAIKTSIFLMIFGALMAAISDLAFDLEGYIFIFISDVFTALNGVVMKKILVSCPSITKLSVLFYNSCMGMVIMLGMFACKGDEWQKVKLFEHWNEPNFVIAFFLASVMGSILNYSVFLCTLYNSALTTTVVGCLKNILTTYIGMVLLKDYVFNWSNFLGLNISILGSLIYSASELRQIMQRREPTMASFSALMSSAANRQRKAASGTNISKHREAELVRLLEEPPSGSGRADSKEEDATLV